MTTLIEYMKECKRLRLHDILYFQYYIEKKLQKGLKGLIFVNFMDTPCI